MSGNNSLISFTVRMEFSPDDRAELKTILQALTTESRKEPGCVSYIPHFVNGEPCTVLIYEQYKDDDALQFHRNSPHFAQYGIGGLYQLMKQRDLEELEAVL
jgi:quinol monooxygenase YgiN